MFRLVPSLEHSEAIHFLAFSSRVQSTSSHYSSATFNIFFTTSIFALALTFSTTQNFVLRLLDTIFCCTEIIFTPELEFKKPIILFLDLFFLSERDIMLLVEINTKYFNLLAVLVFPTPFIFCSSHQVQY